MLRLFVDFDIALIDCGCMLCFLVLIIVLLAFLGVCLLLLLRVCFVICCFACVIN